MIYLGKVKVILKVEFESLLWYYSDYSKSYLQLTYKWYERKQKK